MRITSQGTAFTAVSVHTKEKTLQDLTQELPTLSMSQEDDRSITKDFVYKTQNRSSFSNKTVIFEDDISHKKVAISLQNTTIEKLQKHFSDENNFYERKDGTLRLNGAAESFVAGWFADVAYKREALEADTNSDGQLNENEYRQTKSFYHGYVDVTQNETSIISIEDVITENYADGSKLNPNDYAQHLKNGVTTIDQLVDNTLNSDKDHNGKIELSEFLKFTYQTDSTINAVIKDAKDLFGGNLDSKLNNSLDKAIEKSIKRKKEQDEEYLKKMEALQRLIASGGDVSVLNAEEKILLQNELSHYKTKNESYDLNDLKNVVETMEKTKEYKQKLQDATRGNYYEDKA